MTTVTGDYYRGWRDADGTCHVVAREDGKPGHRLPMRLDLDNHSPTGFNWGYHGSGPAQLALALLAHALGDDARALRLHQPFKREVIARLNQDENWTMTKEGIIAAAYVIECMEAGLKP